MKLHAFGRLAAPLLAALAMAAAAMAVPVLSARSQEEALLTAARARPDLGGILWEPAVRGNPVLYDLHRVELLGDDYGADTVPAGEAAADAAAAALDALLEAGVLDTGAHDALCSMLADPETTLTGFGGRAFYQLDFYTNSGRTLQLSFHAGTGAVTGFYCYGIEVSPPDSALPAWLAMLGLDVLEDWEDWETTGEPGSGSLRVSSALGQVTASLDRYAGSGFALALAADPG